MSSKLIPAAALIAVAALILAACGGAAPPADEAPPTPDVAFAHPDYIISAPDLLALVQDETADLVLLDARAQNAYADGHLPGATSLSPDRLNRSDGDFPFQVSGPDEIAPILQAAGISADSRVVIYDVGGTYNAARVWWVLDYYGHPNKAVLDGGFAAWNVVDGPLETIQTAVEPGDFQPVADPTRIADYQYVLDHLGSDATAICDARRAADYDEAAIPGALNLPYTDTFDGDSPLLKDAASLQDTFEAVGLEPHQEIIFYCIGGYLSAQDYLLARTLGYSNVRIYDGSSIEWNQRGGPTDPGGA